MLIETWFARASSLGRCCLKPPLGSYLESLANKHSKAKATVVEV